MSQLQLLERKNFSALFWTQFLSSFNDNFLKNALVMWITFRSIHWLGLDSPLLVALCSALFIFPFFIFSATSGQIADRYDKSMPIRWTKTAEIGIMAIASIGFISESLPLGIVALLGMGVHSAFFGPVKYGILTQILEEDELMGGNALIEMGTFLAILLGTMGGGILILLPSGAIGVSAVLMICAGVGWVIAQRVPRLPPVAPTLEIEWNLVTPTAHILGISRENRSVFRSILLISWFWAYGAVFLSVFPHYAKNVVHGSEGVVTYFLALFSIGIGVGSLLCERLVRTKNALKLVPWGSLGVAVFALDLFLIGQPEWKQAEPLRVLELLSTFTGMRMSVDLLGVAISSGLFVVPLNTYIQAATARDKASRVIAGNNIWNALFMVCASLLLMLLFSRGVSVPQVYLMIAAVSGAIAVYKFRV